MRTEIEVLSQLTNFFKNNENIRTAILTSSRANNNTTTDFLSDYDVELLVKNTKQIKKNDNWLKPLGDIMVRLPYIPQYTFFDNWITRLILFYDGIRIDFQITDKKNIYPKFYDYGLKILIDKDNISKKFSKPTYSKYNTKKPSKEEYEKLVNEFWWNATYVPKYLWRNEIPFAKFMLDHTVRDKYLATVIKWYIGMENNWKVNSGIYGKYFEKYLDNNIWEKLKKVYCGAKIEENWDSFFIAIELFSELAKKIGIELGYNYPNEIEKNMKAYYLKIKNTKKNIQGHEIVK